MTSVIDCVVIPVAGKGSRMDPLTRAVPKELLPLGRKPALQWIVEELLSCGFKQLIFVTAEGKEAIERHFAGEAFRRKLLENAEIAETVDLGDVAFQYVRQVRQSGLGDAIHCAQSLVGDRSFAVALGDCVLGVQKKSDVLQRMTSHQAATGCQISIAFETVPDDQVQRFGIARPASSGEEFRLEDVVEKPAPKDAPSNLAIAGRYILCPEIFEALDATQWGVGNEIQLTDAIRTLIARGLPAAGFVLGADERRFDVGDFESYFHAFEQFANSVEQCETT